jgi:predicted membrane protein (TIGR00267 family)
MIQEYLPEKFQISPISRRYFISNGFDGALTFTGLAMGSVLSGANNLMVFKIAAGAAVGLATSGVWSVWEIEKAEKIAQVREMEEAMLENLEDSAVMENKMEDRKSNAIMSGLGPIMTIMLPASVFLIPLTSMQALMGAIGAAVGMLFLFGMYMAEISKRNRYVAGARMGLAGLVVALLNYILPG